MATRTITGTIKNSQGTAVSGATVSFTMEGGTFTVGPDVTYLASGVTATTDTTGAFSVTLTSGLDVYWLCRLPDGSGFRFALPDGSTTTIEALRSASEGLPVPITTGADILLTAAARGQLLSHNGTQFVNTPSETLPDGATNTAGYAALYNLGDADPNAVHGWIWPEEARMGFTVARKYTTGGAQGGPTASFTTHLDVNQADADGVAMMATGTANVNQAAVWGANMVVLNEPGTTLTKLVGLEIDVQPTVGTTVTNSFGLGLLAGGLANIGPAIQMGELGGGASWTNGIELDAIGSGSSGIYVKTGAAQMAYGIYLSEGTYGGAALVTGAVNDAPSALIRQSSYVTPTTVIFAVQNSGGTHNFLSVDTTGNTIMRAKTATALSVGLDVATAGQVAQLELRDAGTTKWYLRKLADNSFDIYNAAAAGPALSISSASDIAVAGVFALPDGITAPSATVGQAKLYVDTADGDLKVIFGDGTVKTIVVDS